MDVEFKPGDIIQDYCDPFAKILFQNQKGRRCDNCFKGSPQLLRCGGCQLMCYCDKMCQKKDWKAGHSLECKSDFFKKPTQNVGQPSDFKRQMCRLFAILKQKPERGKKKFLLYDGTERSFEDLLSHQQELKKDFRFVLFCEDMAQSLEQEKSSTSDEDALDYLLRLAGVWKTNAFPILNESESATIGSAIFIEPSVFDHSCKPTAFFNLQGCKMQIRAIGPIPKGEKPHVTYLVGHRTKKERAALLMERYNFVCKCERCILEETKNLVDYDKLTGLISRISNQYNWKEYLKTHKDILALMRKLYHEYDERITNRIFLTYQESGPLGAPKEKVKKLGNNAEEHLRITFGSESPDYQKYLKLSIYL